MQKTLFIAAFAVLGAVSNAQFQINELVINGPGADNGKEYIEITGTVGASVNNLWFLSIEGDGSAAGVIDQAVQLSGVIGSDGLFLVRDSATLLNGQAEAADQVFNFTPDLENGSNTYMLVTGYTGFAPTVNGQDGSIDIDTDNDGTFGDFGTLSGGTTVGGGSQPWTTVLDAVGWNEASGASDWSYASQVGGYDFNDINLVVSTGTGADEAPSSVIRIGNDLVAVEFGAGQNGTFYDGGGVPTYDSSYVSSIGATYGTIDGTAWSPGSANPVPEPGTMAALAMGATALLKRRKR